MRILVEAMCAQFGGIRTYVEHLLAAWPDEFPEDEVHVLLRADSDLPTGSAIVRHVAEVRRPDALGRPLAQTVHLPRLSRRLRPDVVLATNPSTTVRGVGAPMAVVIYDLRHELRPEQFSWQQRALRAVSYRRGYALADGLVSISHRSLDDLHRLHPRTRRTPAVVAHLGADHVDTWPTAPEPGPAVTFAHHSNKNLELVLQAWQRMARTPAPTPPLLVLGLGSARRAGLAERLRQLRLDDVVRLAPFLPDAEFQQVFASSRMIVFPSDFEGFGLPLAEGMRLGIPVVIGPERATQEVAGGHAVVMTDWTPEALAAAVRRAQDLPATDLAAAREHAERYTWANTARSTRALLDRIVATQPAGTG